MKQLQTQKTYGVMSKIYAELQTLARDEGVTVVMEKPMFSTAKTRST